MNAKKSFSRRLRHRISTLEYANRVHNDPYQNYRKMFGINHSPNPLTQFDDNVRKEYNKICKKRTAMLLHDYKGSMFTRKKTTHKRRMMDCINDQGIYNLFKIIKELSIYKPSDKDKKDYSKLKIIRNVIKNNGSENMLDYLLSYDGFMDLLDKSNYEELKSHVKIILLKEIFIKNTFKNTMRNTKIKFSQRRNIREYTPNR
jgi:hypothetical protein